MVNVPVQLTLNLGCNTAMVYTCRKGGILFSTTDKNKDCYIVQERTNTNGNHEYCIYSN